MAMIGLPESFGGQDDIRDETAQTTNNLKVNTMGHVGPDGTAMWSHSLS